MQFDENDNEKNKPHLMTLLYAKKKLKVAE